MSTVKSIEERTKSNLTLSLSELGLVDGQELMVADQTTPNTITIKLKFAVQEVEMNWMDFVVQQKKKFVRLILQCNDEFI